MAFQKTSDYAVGDVNFTSFMNSLDTTRRGGSSITLSNYDNDSAPVVKVGSWFENNGALYEVITGDETPTGYSGISNSTTFYLYYDDSGDEFIYSSTAPTWSDSKQGWYNGNDRALFSMYKDSGGTLYQLKTAMQKESFQNEITAEKIKSRVSGKAVGLQEENGEILRYKVFTEVLSSASYVTVTHGITNGKIRVISASFVNSVDAEVTDWLTTSTQIRVNFNGSGSGTCYILVFYAD